MSQLILSGGDTEKDLAFKKSEVNHLRLVLAWMRCEYMLDEDVQRGFAESAKMLVDADICTQERAQELLCRKAAEIRYVPQYVRHGVKMLTKMLREHDKVGDMVDGEVIPAQALGQGMAHLQGEKHLQGVEHLQGKKYLQGPKR